jgi:hypothetical protein
MMKRVLQCAWAAASVLWTTSAFSTPARTITVTSQADSGIGSLREAIEEAVDGDIIRFDLESPSSITLLETLTVGKSLTLDGGEKRYFITINGGERTRVFSISEGATVTFKGISITGGRANGSSGGGIDNKGNLTLIRSFVAGNTANGDGGGIYNHSSAALTVVESNFYCNVVQSEQDGRGGAIYNQGTLKVESSLFTCNEVFGERSAGGAIYNSASGTLSVARSFVAGNVTPHGDGGGIYNAGTIAAIANSTIENNVAGVEGRGGGIYNSGSITALLSDTFSRNTSIVEAGGSVAPGVGIYNIGRPIPSTNSILHDCAGVVIDNGGNLDAGASCALSAATSKSNAALNLDLPTDNGGNTVSMLPQAGSDAIGRGIAGACASAPVDGLDQRGALRGSACTAGAVEVGGLFALDVDVSGRGTVSELAAIDRIHCTGEASPCRATYSADPADFASVTLVATADAGSRFVGWSGDCAAAGTNADATVAVNAQRTCGAFFSPSTSATAVPTLNGWAAVLLAALSTLAAETCLRRSAIRR